MEPPINRSLKKGTNSSPTHQSAVLGSGAGEGEVGEAIHHLLQLLPLPREPHHRLARNEKAPRREIRPRTPQIRRFLQKPRSGRARAGCSGVMLLPLSPPRLARAAGRGLLPSRAAGGILGRGGFSRFRVRTLRCFCLLGGWFALEGRMVPEKRGGLGP